MVNRSLSFFNLSAPEVSVNITTYALFTLITIVIVFWILSIFIERILSLLSKTLYDLLFLPGTFIRYKIKSFFAHIFGIQVLEKSVLENRFRHEEKRAGSLVWTNVFFPLLIEGYLGVLFCFYSIKIYGNSLESFLLGVIIFGLGLSFIGKASPSREELEEIRKADDESKKLFTIFAFLALTAYILVRNWLSEPLSLLLFFFIIFFPQNKIFSKSKLSMPFRGINLMDEIKDFEILE